MNPPILILHATGTNRDRDAAWACELAGGAPEIVHVNQLAAGQRRLHDYRMLVLPGGFSYGDDLGAGKLWAVALRHRIGEDLQAFVAAGRPVLGICNGFQALVKAGLLPGLNDEVGTMNDELRTPDSSFILHHSSFSHQATLTRNDSARFECRWVYLEPQAGSPCVFTQGLEEPIYCPAAHGEGKFVARDATTLAGYGGARTGGAALSTTARKRLKPLLPAARAIRGTPTARRLTSPASATRPERSSA
ncbi:MAG: phosphoribosylformylglycinamidine synthase subunit PurQ [Anaerolineae bacterium]